MSLICEQMELDLHPWKMEAVEEFAEKILNNLRDYGDNGPVKINMEHDYESENMYAAQVLKKHKVILYKDWSGNGLLGLRVAVINRYKLELIHSELMWLRKSEEEKEDTAPFADQVAYYDMSTGHILVNGVFKRLRKPYKLVFDELFVASPDFVSRKKLLSLLGAGRKDKSSKIVINEAISNLRRVCGVKKYTIQLRPIGARLRNIEVHPLSAQLPPPSFLTDGDPEKPKSYLC